MQIILSSHPKHNETLNDDFSETEEIEIRNFAILADKHGQRLDKALSELVPELSRSYINQLIDKGAAILNGQACTKNSKKIKIGDEIKIHLLPSPASSAFKPEDIEINIIYEDEHIAIIDKAAGMVVHPAAGNWSGTLLNALLHKYQNAAELPRAGIVHRLDKDTSGLMVVGRSKAAVDKLIQEIAQRKIHRQYLAIAHGHLEKKEQEINEPIARDTKNRLKMGVATAQNTSAKPANTHIKSLHQSQIDKTKYNIVQCVLGTGRTHQIRVHMAHIGHSLVADTTYAGKPALCLTRQALHAHKLNLNHPITNQPLNFTSPPPQDIQNALDKLNWQEK